jgi:ABC-type taurine transport system substrate-binding protein
MITQVTSSKIIQDKVKVFAVLKGAFHIDYEWIVKATQDFLLVQNRLHTLLDDYSEYHDDVL